MEEEFNYIIGSYQWEGLYHVNDYCYGNTVWYGTIEDARSTLEFLQTKTTKELRIFKLVEIGKTNETS